MPKSLDVPQPLKSIDADVLHNLVTSFIFVSIDALHAELRQIQTLLPTISVPQVQPNASTTSVMALGECVSNALSFALPPTDDKLRDALSHLPSSQIQLLALRLRLLTHRWIELVEEHQCQLFAVSPIWHHRWRLLIEGRLHPAYIGGVFY